MKKTYLFIVSIIISFFGYSQINLPPINSIAIDSPYELNLSKKNKTNKTVNCIDTVNYPASKLTNLVEIDSMGVGYIEGVSQGYHFTGNAKIHGINAFILLDLDGVSGNSDSASMVVSIYSTVDIDSNYPNKPNSLIHTDTLNVFDVGFQEQTLMFDTLVDVSDSFAVVIELNMNQLPASPIWYGFNGYGDGNQEKLAWAIYAGNLYNTYTDWQSSGGWDVDMLLSPIVNMDITSSYTSDKDTIYPNDAVVFTNTSTNITDIMFNLYNATTSPLYTWDFDDGTGTYNPFDTSYVFTNSGDYNTQLIANYYGYTLNCMDSDSKPIHVNFALAVEEAEETKTVSIYPIPASKYFNVNVPNQYLDGEIIVTDVVGKKLVSKQIQKESKVKLTTENLVSDIYFVSIDLQGERVYTQRIVVDK